MAEDEKGTIGYFVAGFGALMMLIVLYLTFKNILPVREDKAILVTLIVVSALLIGLGMYVVVPKRAHEAVADYGGLARDIVPRFGLRRQENPPAEITPAANQSAIVHPAEGPAIQVSPSGETKPVSDAEVAAATHPPVLSELELPQPDPEMATGTALPLMAEAPRRTRATNDPRQPAREIGPATRKRQEKYPPDEA